MVLANLLKHMGVHATAVTSPDEARARMDGGPWDMLFVQGTSKPYPGKELASLVLDRCSPSKPGVVLLTRAGDTLLADAGRWSAVGLLQWPFSPEKVGKILTEVMPKTKSARLRQG
jgi:CheY-like chemotaxis protein